MTVPARILIVDDDLPFQQALRDALSPPYDVLTTQTGSAALQLIPRETLDLVLLDYVLPDISGLSVLRTIKKLSPSLLVILMTGLGSEEVSVECFRSGARDYFKKPFKLSALLERIEGLLAVRNGHAQSRSPALPDPRETPSPPAPGSRAASIQRALAYIEAHFGDPIGLAEVAREAGMSKFHFCRSLWALTGMSFRDHLAHFRIARAAELLRNPNTSVTEACFEAGFNDLTHFGRTFRRVTGHGPSAYRRTQRPAPEIPVPPASGKSASAHPPEPLA